MKNTEILAPVGGAEQLLAAVRCGADAVYLGTKGFNARRSAENFESAGLKETVAYCHTHGVKVHVTVNTLVMDSELEELERTVDEIAAAGADAVIVQDFAVMELIRNRYPDLPIHASTQCVVHNAAGARELKKLGCSRVVVARELSLEEIRTIRREADVEVEAFVHGALCMCVSGACYLSGVIGGRSGNRGMCAQPCRLDFACNDKHYSLSLKDMSHIARIRDLAQAGVCSFKIEGRMKRPEYVAAAVTACRQALAGEPFDAETLRAVFSRSGFTDGYLTGRRGAEMFGYRSREDVTAAPQVFKGLQRLYDKEQPRIPLDMALRIAPGKPAELTVTCGEDRLTVLGEPPIPAEHPTDRDYAAKSLEKCGGTPYFLRNLTVENAGAWMVPPSALNRIRREALVQLDSLRGRIVPHTAESFSFRAEPYTPPEKSAYWARFARWEQISDPAQFEKVVLPLEEILAHPEAAELGERLIAEFPALSFPETESRTREQAGQVRRLGVENAWAENIYAIGMARELGFRVFGGAGLNIMNTPALETYRRMGLAAATVSFELAMDRIAHLQGSLPRGYLVYGRLPVMRVRNCPRRAAGGCGSCDGAPFLTDRKGMRFPMRCRERQFTTIYNSVPLHLADRRLAPADFLLLYFTVESRAACAAAAEDFRLGRPFAGERTGGLYYRKLQ